MKKFFCLMAVLINCLVGGAFAAAAGVSPVIGAVGLNAVAAVSPLIMPQSGMLRAGLYAEIWTG